MGISTAYLPVDSPNINISLLQSINFVNCDLGFVPTQIGVWSVYQQAVFNLGGHLLVEYAPDQSWSISSVSWSGGLATVTTSVDNTLSVADTILLSGISPLPYVQPGRSGTPPNPNAPIVVYSVLSPTVFQYPLQPNPGAAIVSSSATVTQLYFSWLRSKFGMANFTPGLVSSTGDQGTSVSLVTPPWAQTLGIYALQLFKTPWGRAYASLAAEYGPNIWGLS